MANVFKVAEEMEFTIVGSCSEYMVTFQCCVKGALLQLLLQKGRFL